MPPTRRRQGKGDINGKPSGPIMGVNSKLTVLLVGILFTAFVVFKQKETIEGGFLRTVVGRSTSTALVRTTGTNSAVENLQSNLAALNKEIEVLKAGQVAHESHVSFLNDKVKNLNSQLIVLQEQINENKAHLRVVAASQALPANAAAADDASSLRRQQQEQQEQQEQEQEQETPNDAASSASSGDHKQQQQQLLEPQPNPDRKVLYSRARTDRAGSSVMDMLMAHAYAHSKGAAYGGACRDDADFAKRNSEYKYSKSSEVLEARDKDKYTLLDTLGVSQVLPYGVPCPLDKKQIAMTPDKQKYRADYDLGSIFTPEWLDFIRDNVQYPPKPKLKAGEHPIKTVAVHIRRGDVGFCKYYADRYIPNRYYLETIDEFIQKEHKKDPNARFNVTIFSEKDSSESFDEFRELGFNVHLEDDLPYVWRSMMVADILIMGRSAFSAVPALLNTHGTVVYAPYKYKPLEHWKMPKHSTIAGITPEVERLRKDASNPCKGQYHWKKRERVYDVTE